MEADKMQIPGWRIESRFHNKVLIGNWSEERRKFQKLNNPFGNTTHRVDFSKYSHGNYLPDMKIRREALLRNEGLPKNFVFSHGDRYSNNLISWYDQHMNRRELHESTQKLRQWDGKSTSFKPEKTDHPLQGSSTKFGLHEKLKDKWRKESENEDISDFESTYKLSYPSHSQSALVTGHFASQKPLSSHFNTHNKINKNLPFRDNVVNIAPEFIPIAV